MADELLAEVRGRLKANVDAEYRTGLVRYFRETIDAYGVRTAQVRRIAAAAYRVLKGRPAAEQNRFSNELWRSGKFEEGAVAIALYQRFRRECAGCEFKLFERWIDRYVGNWAHCDGVASWLIAACLENEPALLERLPPWTRSENRWKRRAAAVALLQEAKKGRNTQFIFRIAGALLDDPDDMVRKGVGWLLKETYPRRPGETVAFLRERAARAPRLVLRIAAEKMTVEDKAAVLR